MQLERDYIKQQDSDLTRIYDFLTSEGLSFDESEQVLSKMYEIHYNMMTLNKSYSISEISKIIINLLDDDFFDENFITCLLEELSQTSIKWEPLYSMISLEESSVYTC